MKIRIASSLLATFGSLAVTSAAVAASLPAIVANSSNKVPECVTPGRLTAFLSSRNSNLNDKYAKIAVDYMRNGEDLGVRWDYGFFQMIVETDGLKYTGDVKPQQNNFAGLGATGGGVRGESFDSVSDGVRAHLQHVLMYTGKYIDEPVADRTRKVQEWQVLDKWRRGLSGPMTFTHLTQKWSPGDRGYPRDIQAIADLFFNQHCNAPDPYPGMVAEARAGRKNNSAQANNTSAATTIAAVTPAADSSNSRVATLAPAQGLGAAMAEAKRGTSTSTGSKRVAILNAPKKNDLTPSADPSSKITSPHSGSDAKNSAQGSSNCRVWTASYGGAKALIIRASDKGITNYTVLDVNVGREQREANAYIAAYAKGGKSVGEFPSPEKALKQAFELCPEG